LVRGDTRELPDLSVREACAAAEYRGEHPVKIGCHAKILALARERARQPRRGGRRYWPSDEAKRPRHHGRMRPGKAVNDRQREVLAKIGSDNDAVSSDNPDLAVTVYALRDRGLVTTIRRPGGGWDARITEAGRFFVAEGRYPDTAKPSRKEPASTRVEAPNRGNQPAPTGEDVITLLDGKRYGSVRITTDGDAAGWRAAIRDVNDRGLVGAHHHVRGLRRGELLTLRLEEGTAPPGIRAQRDATPVPVPVTLGRAHPIVSGLRARESLGVSRHLNSRVLRLVQGLIVEAERRGLTVEPAADLRHHFRVGRAQHLYPIALHEIQDRVPHEATAKELQRAARESWYRVPDKDTVASGRLILELPPTYRGARYRWTEGKRWRVEDKLNDVLIEVDARVTVDEDRDREREREARERQLQWAAAMETAQDRYVEDRRANALRAQATQWHEARLLREYCDALEARLAANEDQVQSDRAWLSWARDYIERIDPNDGVAEMPAIPAAKPEDLTPFLDGWSPNAPERRRRW